MSPKRRQNNENGRARRQTNETNGSFKSENGIDMEIDVPNSSRSSQIDVDAQSILSGYGKNRDEDETVIAEYPIVLLRPPQGHSVERLMFNHPKPAKMEHCSARLKQKVRHLEVDYDSTKHSFNDKTSVFDGQYYGESTTSADIPQYHACAFFQDGKMYLVPIQNTYEMQRRIHNVKETDHVEKAKIDDAKLAELNAPSVANPVRIKFARQETEWQKKRREQSANYRQQLIDQDPWMPLQVRAAEPTKFFGSQIRQADSRPPIYLEAEDVPIL